MSFLTWEEIKLLSKKIGCDTFIKKRTLYFDTDKELITEPEITVVKNGHNNKPFYEDEIIDCDFITGTNKELEEEEEQTKELENEQTDERSRKQKT